MNTAFLILAALSNLNKTIMPIKMIATVRIPVNMGVTFA